MRPRVFPAEDVRELQAMGALGAASMRPRVFPAEDPHRLDRSDAEPRKASMRPRVFPAEDLADSPHGRTLRRCFNEAAGIPRGRLRESYCETGKGSSGFNEAAGIPRGRPPVGRR